MFHLKNSFHISENNPVSFICYYMRMMKTFSEIYKFRVCFESLLLIEGLSPCPVQATPYYKYTVRLNVDSVLFEKPVE